MTSEIYLRILHDRLDEARVDPEIAQKTLARERATLSGVNDSAITALLSEERLDFLVSTAIKRSQNSAGDKLDKSYLKSDTESTIVTQVSRTSATEAATVIPFSSPDQTRLPSQDKVPAIQEQSIPRRLLDSDTATVVISKSADHRQTPMPDATTAFPVTPGKESDVEKLLNERDTVHISEKATVEFLTLVDEKTVILDKAPTLDEAFTVPISASPGTDHCAKPEDDVNLLPFIDKAHHQKKQDAIAQNTVLQTPPPAQKSISDEDLKNPHIALLTVFTLIILFPFCLSFFLLFAAYFIPTLAILFIISCLPVAFYTLTVSFSGGGILYGAFFAIRASTQSEFEKALPFGICFLVCTAVFTLSLLFLHKAIIPAHNDLKKIFRSFLKKNLSFLKILIRIFVKSIRHA